MTQLTVSEEEFREEALTLLSYLLVSARGVINEPKLYAPFRLAEGAFRFTMLLDKIGLGDPEWTEIGKDVERKLLRALTDEERHALILDELVLRVTACVKKL